MSDSQHKTLTDKVESLIEELSSTCVERVSLNADFDEMTTLVHRLKDDVGNSLFGVSADVQNTYEDTVDAVKMMIQEDLVDGWKKVETHFQVQSARLAVSAGVELLRQFSDVQSSLEKSSALSSSRVAKELDVGSRSNKSPSVRSEKGRKPRKASGSKGAKKTG